jgi:tRNA U55 pseudouridine synthase TruB
MKLRELARSSSNIEYRDSSEGKIVEFILKDNSNKKFLKKSENGKVQILLPSKKVKVSIELLKTRIIKKDDIGLQGLKESSYSILDLKVDCSKGTYIRSLAHDIALELASDAFLLSLRRTNIDTINISDAISIEDIPEIR